MVYEIRIRYSKENADEKTDKIRLIIEKYKGAFIDRKEEAIIYLTEGNNSVEQMVKDLENIGIDVLSSERKSERRFIDGLKHVIEETIDFLSLWR